MMTSSEKFPRVQPISPTGTALVRHYHDGASWRATWDAQTLQTLEPSSEAAPDNLWIAPGLFDVQVNGYGGVDFQRAQTSESLHHAVQALQRDGCPRILLTLITAPWRELLARLSAHRKIIRQDPVLSRAIPGWHIEGPFLSDQPGFSGAHNPDWMEDPSPERIQELKAVVGDDPVLMTFAPERAHSAPAIAEARRCGFVVSFGHTNASTDQMQEGIAAGGTAFTHLGNGCTQQLDRHDNILWRVLDNKTLMAGIIPDTIHVSPPLFRIMHRVLGPARVYWTTDAIAAAGAPPGHYSVGALELHVGADRIARNLVTKTFAGSALEPIEGIRRGARMLGLPWQKAWNFLSLQPAHLMKLPNEIAVGSPAGFCLLQDA